MSKTRLDLLVVTRGLAATRHEAQTLIRLGKVYGPGGRLDKPGTAVPRDLEVRLKEEERYCSRGGYKLESALEAFALDPSGWVCLDVGASTGGFTDCLLQRGAARVYALDVGRSLLHEKVRRDPRVTVLEAVNARNFDASTIPEPVDLATVDVSFISLTLVLPPLLPVLRPGGLLLPMVKPQFELGRERVPRGGVVRREEDRLAAVEKVEACAAAIGLEIAGRAPSGLKGPKGNQEYFLLLKKPLEGLKA
jgi:23S rRNA (cytidine1920-2'-O)/16S rRNA (cytidine1409-2'-O)-methyltransferase